VMYNTLQKNLQLIPTLLHAQPHRPNFYLYHTTLRRPFEAAADVSTGLPSSVFNGPPYKVNAP